MSGGAFVGGGGGGGGGGLLSVPQLPHTKLTQTRQR